MTAEVWRRAVFRSAGGSSRACPHFPPPIFPWPATRARGLRKTRFWALTLRRGYGGLPPILDFFGEAIEIADLQPFSVVQDHLTGEAAEYLMLHRPKEPQVGR